MCACAVRDVWLLGSVCSNADPRALLPSWFLRACVLSITGGARQVGMLLFNSCGAQGDEAQILKSLLFLDVVVNIPGL